MSKRALQKGYPSDVNDEEWAFVAPYLCLLTEDCGQRVHSLREVFNGLRYLVRAGCPWRMIPHDLPPWEMIYQQSQRWIKAGVFETMTHDLRAVLRLLDGRHSQPSAVILDGRTVQSSPESGGRAGFDGHKKKRQQNSHCGGHPRPPARSARYSGQRANEQERDQVGVLAEAVQEVTGENVQVAFVDQGYTGERAEEAAAEHGIRLEVVKLAEAKKGFVLLLRRWVVERSSGWIARCRRLARDYERLPTTLVGLTWVFFAGLLLARFHL